MIRRPISMWPIQWFTPSNGLFHSWATVRATTATETSGAPMPGPRETEMRVRILWILGKTELGKVRDARGEVGVVVVGKESSGLF